MNRKLKYSRLSFFKLVILALFFFASLAAQAQDKTLKVGVSFGDPFVIATSNKEYSGIAIDIWKQLAEELHLNYQMVPLGEHIDEAVQMLASGQIDILIGPIVPTYERLKLVDFMQPFYLNQIGLVVPVERISFLKALNSIFVGPIKWALLILLLFFIIYLNVYWYYELRPKHKAHKKYLHGIMESFWIHTLDIDLGVLPSHIHTRQIRFVWLILLTIFFSSITASITSALTIALSDQYANDNNINLFKNKQIAAVINAAPYDIAKEMGFTNLVGVNSREEAIELVLNGQVSGYMDYYPIAEYYLSQHQLTGKLRTGDLIVQRDTFAFALPINSPLRHPLNLKLRHLQEFGSLKLVCEKYFDNNPKSTINCEI